MPKGRPRCLLINQWGGKNLLPFYRLPLQLPNNSFNSCFHFLLLVAFLYSFIKKSKSTLIFLWRWSGGGGGAFQRFSENMNVSSPLPLQHLTILNSLNLAAYLNAVEFYLDTPRAWCKMGSSPHFLQWQDAPELNLKWLNRKGWFPCNKKVQGHRRLICLCHIHTFRHFEAQHLGHKPTPVTQVGLEQKVWFLRKFLAAGSRKINFYLFSELY